MNKKPILFTITAIFVSILILNLASAYSYYYYPPHYNYGSNGYGSYANYGNNYRNYAGDSYSQTTYYTNRESSINYYPWGKERVTTYTNQKITVEKMYNPPVYHTRYFNTYTTPYYYAPRYDSHQGYYNWKY